MTYEEATEKDIQVHLHKFEYKLHFFLMFFYAPFYLQALHQRITQLLLACKDAFASVCNNFNFFKFHIIIHCPDQARQWGNLDVMDAARSFYYNISCIFNVFFQIRRNAQALLQGHLSNDAKAHPYA